MELLTASAGSYPRIGDKPERQKHRQAYARWERGELSDEEFERVQAEVTQEVIEEQVRAGLDLVTDGQVRWYDPISHFARKLSGCEVDGLLRFFDTNFYFRQPVIVGDVSWREPVVVEEFRFAKEVSKAPLKPVLTGPYTLAKLSINRRGVRFKELLREFADAISREVGELANAGADLIQIDEPAILKNQKEFELLKTAIGEVAVDKGKAKLALYTYFGDAAPLYRKFVKLPVDVIGFDFTYSPKLPGTIARLGCKKDLGLGLIDGRNTRLEGEEEVLATLRKLLPKIGSERVYLSPSCGLGEYLPRNTAFEKLKRTVSIVQKAKEELS
jgi:5-methyltetrahydropteroyltriglutamate--homocysteine methyltransferase